MPPPAIHMTCRSDRKSSGVLTACAVWGLPRFAQICRACVGRRATREVGPSWQFGLVWKDGIVRKLSKGHIGPCNPDSLTIYITIQHAA